MGKRQDLEEQLSKLKQAEEIILERIDNSMKLPDAKKKELWDGVVPILTSALSSRIKGGVWNQAEIKQIVLEKCLKVVFGEDILTNMERF